MTSIPICHATAWISHRSTNQYDETSTMVGRWRANVILQRQMSKDSIFMHVWRLNLVWQERSINMEWRPRKNCFWNFVKVKSLTAGFILQLIKEQAQIVIRKVKVQTVLDQNLHSFYFTSYCWLWEIVTTEHLDPAAAAGEIRDGDGLAWCQWYRAMPCIESTKIILFGLKSDHCFTLTTKWLTD